jgi:hypothetical protein
MVEKSHHSRNSGQNPGQIVELFHPVGRFIPMKTGEEVFYPFGLPVTECLGQTIPDYLVITPVTEVVVFTSKHQTIIWILYWQFNV